jgi:tetratricopeptide (TPR) repeat protein
MKQLYLFGFFLASLLILLPAPARAQGDDVSLGAANQAFEDGRYDEAARLFQQLIEQRGYSAPLCFNLGNAEAKAGNMGLALLNYERARYLAPGDGDINHNLQLARKQAGLDPDPYRWWQVVLRSIDWTVWLGVIVACLMLLFFAMIGTAFAPAWARVTRIPVDRLRTIFRGIFFAGIPLFLFFGFVELSAVGFNDRVEGVIVAKKEAPLFLSPFDSAERTGAVPEGELVTVEVHHGGYFWVDERSHQSGWVKDADLEPVIAGSFNPTN